MAAVPFGHNASRLRFLLPIVPVLLILSAPARGDDWKYDIVTLKANQTVLKGLLVNYSETADEIEFRAVTRKPGERTRVENFVFKRSQIASVETITAEERAHLDERIKALDVTGKELAERIRNLKFKEIAFGKASLKNGYRYEGTHFTLESNVKEELFRRTAVRLAQVFQAYARTLPPHNISDRPITIRLAGSQADYQALLKERGITFFSPAFYDLARNQILCGCDLERLGLQLELARKENRRTAAELDRRETDLKKLYSGKVPREVMRPLDGARKQLKAAEAGNDRLYDEATRALMQRLFHECFHAYLANFVYSPDRDRMPRWLNEGLAQIFETAIFEGDEARIGHADPERLKRARAALMNNDLLPLKDLLRSGAKQFLVIHATDRETSDRHYLTAWALTSYLAFEKKILNTKELDAYCRATHEHEDPLAAFAALVGQRPGDLPQFEKDFHGYIQHLRPNGTLARPK